MAVELLAFLIEHTLKTLVAEDLQKVRAWVFLRHAQGVQQTLAVSIDLGE